MRDTSRKQPHALHFLRLHEAGLHFFRLSFLLQALVDIVNCHKNFGWPLVTGTEQGYRVEMHPHVILAGGHVHTEHLREHRLSGCKRLCRWKLVGLHVAPGFIDYLPGSIVDAALGKLRLRQAEQPACGRIVSDDMAIAIHVIQPL